MFDPKKLGLPVETFDPSKLGGATNMNVIGGPTANTTSPGGFLGGIGDVATGIGKEVIGTAQGLAKLPPYAVAKGFEAVTGRTGVSEKVLGLGIPEKDLEAKNAMQSLGKGLGFVGELFTPGLGPEAGLEKIGISGLFKAGEKGLLKPETLDKIIPYVTSKWGSRVATALQDFIGGAGFTAASEVGAGKAPTASEITGGGIVSTVTSPLIRSAIGKFTAGQQEPDLLKPELNSPTFDKARNSAWQDIQPKATPTTATAYASSKSETGGRAVSPSGLITPGELRPTKADTPLLDTYQQLYRNGTIKENMPIDQKLSAVDQRAAQLHQDQKGFLVANDKAVPIADTKSGKGIMSELDRVKSQSTTVFGRDVTAQNAYESTVDVFRKNLVTGKSAGATEGATTLTKIDEALTKFDDEMDKFGAWEREATGQLTDVDKARILAIRNIHQTVRNFISDELPVNSPWKSIRQEESNLYNVAKRMSPKLGATVGESKASAFFKAHPALTKGMLWTGSAIGLGIVGGIGYEAIK